MSCVPGSLARFGVFEADLRSGELCRSGLKIRLQDQPFQVLVLLLERPGEIVTREDLRLRLWSTDTFVDFDHGLNSAIQKLREALGDSADSPRFVEAVPRRGYRFIAPVEKVGEAATQGIQPQKAEQASYRGPARRRALVVAVAALALILGGVLWLYFSRPAAVPEADLKITPFTSYPGSEAFPSFSPDGNQVAFAWRQERKGDYDIYVKLAGSEEPLRLTDNPADDIAPAWSPDGRRIAFYRSGPDRAEIYSVASLGGSERKLVDLVTGPSCGSQLAWSPDGGLLAFEDRKPEDDRWHVFLLSLDTGERRRTVADSGGFVHDVSPAFSPDGRTLAFVGVKGHDAADLYLIPVAGGKATRLTFDSRGISGPAWTPDGRDLVFSSARTGQSGLWRISASGGVPKPLAWAGEVSLPSWAVEMSLGPAISRHWRLVFVRRMEDTNIYRAEIPVS